MRQLFFSLLLIFFTSNLLQGQEIAWMSMNEALEAQKEEPRKIIMDAYTSWCGPCKLLDRNTFTHPDLAAFVNANYYPVKFNAEGNEEINYKEKSFANSGYQPDKTGRNSTHDFARALGINAYPTLVFFDEEGKPIDTLKGYRSANQLEIFLKLFANDDYKDIKSVEAWKEYQENFQPVFSNETS